MPGAQPAYRSRFETFRAALKSHGQVEGRDILIEARWAEDRTERLPALARELAALRPAVLVTSSSAGVAACKQATSTIPIVFATAGDPVQQGFVSSLRRPGGNITGVLVHNIDDKLVEVAREALPQAQRLAILVHEPDPVHKITLAAFVPATERFKFQPIIVRVKRTEDLALAFEEMLRGKPDALYLPGLVFTLSHYRYLVERALEARLPLLSSREETTEAGALLSYGTSREENFRRAASLVDRILRGANPGDLPVEQPERFHLVINLKTAKAIGVTISQATLLRATKVIE